MVTNRLNRHGNHSPYTPRHGIRMALSPRQAVRPHTNVVDGVMVNSRRKSHPVSLNEPQYTTSTNERPTGLTLNSQADAQPSHNMFGIRDVAAPGFFHGNIVRLQAILPILILAIILIGSFISMVSWRLGKSVDAGRSFTRSSVESVDDMSSEISEKRPTNIQDHQVSPKLPRLLHINGMGFTARVRRVGVGTDTELRLPSNIYDAGWYENSVKPGKDGAVVLTGHSFGPSKPGIFHDLKDLKPGDKLSLETGEGKSYQYYIAKLEAFSATDPLEPLLVSAVPGTPGLNLVTELGRYDEINNNYDQRLVVYAVLDSSTKMP